MLTIKTFTMVLTMVCLTGAFIAMPKEKTLGAVITKNLLAYQSKSL